MAAAAGGNPKVVVNSPARPARGAALFSDHAWAGISGSLRLSPRELQIVRGVMDGHTEFAIAAVLGISTHTVHSHIERLHRKLAVADRVGLVMRMVSEFLRNPLPADGKGRHLCPEHAAGRCPLLARGDD